MSNICSISAYTPHHGLPVDPLRRRPRRRSHRFAGIERTALTRGAWVDVARAWLPDADDVFATLVRDVPWRAERRQMYDRVVDVPRLVHTYVIGEELPHPALTDAREALSAHYAASSASRSRPPAAATTATAATPSPGTATPSAAARPPTPWSRSSRSATRASCTCGPALGGADTIAVEMGHGDLVVMGGSCQRTWEHAVPKVAHAGPRISVQFRPLNVF